MTVDVEAERAATPGCAGVAHLNNAGAALPTAATVATVVDHLHLEAEIGGYEAGRRAGPALDAVRASAARLLGAGAHEVVVTGSDTQAFTRALWGAVLGGVVARDRRILADPMAYDTHYLGLLQAAHLTGARLDVVPGAGDGTVDLDALTDALAPGDVGLVALTHVGTHRGAVAPVEEAGGRCRRAGALLFLDACQSLGQVPVDVGRIGCAVVTATGRKWLRAPRGTGLLYVDDAVAERLLPPGIGSPGAVWDDARGYRPLPGTARFTEFEGPIAAQLGLGTALDHLLDLGVDRVAGRVADLAIQLRGLLRGLPRVRVHDEDGRPGSRCGIVPFTVEGIAPDQVAAAATAAGVNVWVTTAAHALLDADGGFPPAAVRASAHYYNTVDELERLVEVVAGLTPR